MNTKQRNHAKNTNPETARQKPVSKAAPLESALLPAGLALPELLSGLSGQETARPLRQQTLLRLQKQRGNAYVQRHLHPEDVQLTEEDEAPLPTEGLGKEEELEGHGDLGRQTVIQREDGPGAAAAAPAAAPASPTANITLTVNPPTIIRSPEADISASHGAEGIAGWCTPAYNVNVTSRTATTIGITVTLSFSIELASEYTGDRLSVLSDHENGHVRIGERLAQQHFVTDLQTNLQALPNFSAGPPIQTQIVTAANAFTTAEGTESRAYDTADYPRMIEAYFGARTPLADLAAASAPIQRMIDALQAFNSYVTNMDALDTDESALENVTHPVINARAALSQTDVSRLQYNPEFKTMVATSQNFVNGMKDHVSETGSVNLNEIELTLATFTWAPSV
ncbi:MAG TPA: hypothetical protein PLD25_02490 [Chloroflexota bacterium]|nr:hypothetical protein [Chloroflexota bacterium]